MDLIRTYGRGSSSSSDDDVNENKKQQKQKQRSRGSARSVYLLTYERKNLNLFPTRKKFVDAILEAINWTAINYGKRKWQCPAVQWWVCCKKFSCYRMALKLTAPIRCNCIQTYLKEKYKIKVVFSSKHYNYYSAHESVCKMNKFVLRSQNHPSLKDLDCYARWKKSYTDNYQKIKNKDGGD